MFKKTCFPLAVFFILLVAAHPKLGYSETLNISQIGSYTTAVPGGIALSGNYAYVACNAGLTVLNVSNPAAPVAAGTCTTTSYAKNVVVQGNYAYVANGPYGMKIVNISNPASPNEVSSYVESLKSTYFLAVSGNYAYLSNYPYSFRTVNISNPNSPVQSGVCTMPGYMYGIAVSGNYAYVADHNSGLQIVNISNPASPSIVGSISTPGPAYDVGIGGSNAYAFVAANNSGLRNISISNPASPSEVGTCNLPTGFNGSFRVAVSGIYAFVAVDTVLHIVNISNPAIPVDVGSYTTPGYINGLAVSGNWVYVSSDKVYILYWTQAGSPTPTATFTPAPTLTPTPVLPNVSGITPHTSLVSTQLNLLLKGRRFTSTSAVKLQNSKTNEVVSTTSFNVQSGNSLTAQFSLPAAAGLFDLILTNAGIDYIFKTLFTTLLPQPQPIQWQKTDLGKVGNASSTGSIVVGDADRDNEAELFVAYNSETVSSLKKVGTNWSVNNFWDVPGESFQKLLVLDGTLDRQLDLYAGSSSPQIYQYQWGQATPSSAVGAGGRLMVAGDGNHDGVQEIFGVSGNPSTGEGVDQWAYNGTSWTNTPVKTIASGNVFTSLVIGNGDNDQSNAKSLFAAYQNASNVTCLYQFKYNGSSWIGTSMTAPGSGQIKSMVLTDIDHNGQSEIYAANQDGKVYQLKFNNPGWSNTPINSVNAVFNQLVVGDGDNDGQDEIYGAGQDGHIWQYRYNGSSWQGADIGNAGTALFAIAVGDGDNHFQNKVYVLGADGHVYQFQAGGITPTFTPTITSTPGPTATPTPIPPTPLPTAPSISGQIIDAKYFMVAPNPVRGTDVNFKFYLKQSAEVEIRIYTPQGSHVLTKPFNFYPQGWNSTIWNATGMANGVYVYIAEAKANGITEKLKKYLALVK